MSKLSARPLKQRMFVLLLVIVSLVLSLHVMPCNADGKPMGVVICGKEMLLSFDNSLVSMYIYFSPLNRNMFEAVSLSSAKRAADMDGLISTVQKDDAKNIHFQVIFDFNSSESELSKIISETEKTISEDSKNIGDELKGATGIYQEYKKVQGGKGSVLTRTYLKSKAKAQTPSVVCSENAEFNEGEVSGYLLRTFDEKASKEISKDIPGTITLQGKVYKTDVLDGKYHKPVGEFVVAELGSVDDLARLKQGVLPALEISTTAQAGLVLYREADATGAILKEIAIEKNDQLVCMVEYKTDKRTVTVFNDKLMAELKKKDSLNKDYKIQDIGSLTNDAMLQLYAGLPVTTNHNRGAVASKISETNQALLKALEKKRR